MSIFIDVFSWLLIETVLGFIIYSTGCFVLKIMTFGQYKIEFQDYVSFKRSKIHKVDLVWLLGLTFYILLIVLIASAI